MLNGEFTRDDIVVDPDIEVAYDDEDTWLNMYATYNPSEDTLRIDCLIESEDSEKSFVYEPTEQEAELIKGMITDKIRDVCDMTPEEFLEYYGDDISIGGL